MIQQLQDQLENMQQAKDAQELAAAARELENTVKANIQDQQEQAHCVCSGGITTVSYTLAQLQQTQLTMGSAMDGHLATRLQP